MHSLSFFDIFLTPVGLFAIFFMLSHEPDLCFHHGDYLIDLVQFVLGMASMSIMKICSPYISQEIITTVLGLQRYRCSSVLL